MARQAIERELQHNLSRPGRPGAVALDVFEPFEKAADVDKQTGENRWESHPVYDPPLPHYRALPPVDSPLLDGTPYETPRVVEEAIEVEAVPESSELPPEPPREAPAVPRRVPREY